MSRLNKPHTEAECVKGIAIVTAMFRHQDKELRPSMLRFDNDTHVIRILEDSHGHMTVTVRDRNRVGPGVDYKIRFPKLHNKGVVWTFMSADRMAFIAFEPNHPGIITE